MEDNMKVTKSEALTMVRKVRDKKSARYLTMTWEDIKKENAETVKQFEKLTGRPVKRFNSDCPATATN